MKYDEVTKMVFSTTDGYAFSQALVRMMDKRGLEDIQRDENQFIEDVSYLFFLIRKTRAQIIKRLEESERT